MARRCETGLSIARAAGYGLRVAGNRLKFLLAGPILDAFGTKPVLIGFAAMQTVTMAIVAAASVRELGRRRQVEPLEAAA